MNFTQFIKTLAIGYHTRETGNRNKHKKYRHWKDAKRYDMGECDSVKIQAIRKRLNYVWKRGQFVPKCHGMIIQEQIRLLCHPVLGLSRALSNDFYFHFLIVFFITYKTLMIGQTC